VIFQQISCAVSSLPHWLLFFGAPVLLLVVSVVLALLRVKNAFPYAAVALGGVGLFLVNCIGSAQTTVFFVAVYSVCAVLARLLFCFHRPRRRKESRDEEIYRTFHEDLDIAPPSAEPEKQPSERVQSGNDPVELAHAEGLISSLKTANLSPTDRLEVDGIMRSLDRYRGRTLTDSELRTLNDCLGSVLKLTAKYRL